MASRFTGARGAYVPLAYPVVIPLFFSKAISVAKAEPAGTSLNGPDAALLRARAVKPADEPLKTLESPTNGPELLYCQML